VYASVDHGKDCRHRNFDKFKNSSSNEYSSAAPCMMLMIMTVALSNYDYRKFHPTEIFACWCQQEKEFPHTTKFAYSIHAIPPLKCASERRFSTARCVIQH